MAKTKRQKQQEALARKLGRKSAQFEEVRWCWVGWQPGGKHYQAKLEERGKDIADEFAKDATRLFKLAAAEAGCDLHGNPITKEWNDV